MARAAAEQESLAAVEDENEWAIKAKQREIANAQVNPKP